MESVTPRLGTHRMERPPTKRGTRQRVLRPPLHGSLPWAAAALFLGLLAAAPAARAQSLTVRPLSSAPEAAAFERLEWAIGSVPAADNPFDPDQIALDATFTGPPDPATHQPRKLTLPAFWYQDHRRESVGNDGRERLVSTGEPHWRLRFAAPAPGAWELVVTARSRGGQTQSAPLRFAVKPGPAPGFVRAAGHPRYFQFDSGAAYFPIGLNLSWADKRGLGDYDDWLAKLGAAGGNFARVWAPLFGPALETKRSGPGRLDLEYCFYHDQVLAAAGRHGIACMFTLGNYMDLDQSKHWPQNPYNQANGGPASRPAEFASNPAARKLYQRRLRYLVGRYAAFTSLGFWEFWNEQDPKLVPAGWVKEMAAYLKAHDPYRRPVTTSYVGPGDAEVWKLPEIDLTQSHRYGNDAGTLGDLSPILAAAARSHDRFQKPHLSAEFGIMPGNSDLKHDPDGRATNWHNGLWAAAFSGSAGGGVMWYWDYAAAKDRWGTITGLAKFARQVDWPRRHFQPLAVPGPSLPDSGEETFRDAVLPVGGGWGKHDGTPVVVGRDGVITGIVPECLFGPVAARDLRRRAVIKVNLPRPGRLVLRVMEVSEFVNLRVWIDGKPVIDFPFSPLPGAPDVVTTKGIGGQGVYYQATVNKERTVDVPAGVHQIELDQNAGDWLSLGGATVTGAISSRASGLQPLALTDARSGETLVWLRDPESNWQNDRKGVTPRRFERCHLELPAAGAGTYQVDWWDTRKGVIVQTETAVARDGKLGLVIPPFTRDIALRVTRRPG